MEKEKKKRKYEFKKDKKWKKVRIGVAISLAVLLVIGISYALFTTTLTGKKKNVITTGNYELAIENETPENGISLENDYPTTDELGLTREAYEFDLVNKSDIASTYDLYMKVPATVTLSEYNVKYNLMKDGTNVTENPKTFASLYDDNIATMSSTAKHKVKRLGTSAEGFISSVFYGWVDENTVLYDYDLNPTDEKISGNVYVKEGPTGYYFVINLNKYILKTSFHEISPRDIVYNQEDFDFIYKVDSGVIDANSSKHYKFQMWIDEDAGNAAMNKSFEAVAYVHATQTVR